MRQPKGHTRTAKQVRSSRLDGFQDSVNYHLIPQLALNVRNAFNTFIVLHYFFYSCTLHAGLSRCARSRFRYIAL